MQLCYYSCHNSGTWESVIFSVMVRGMKSLRDKTRGDSCQIPKHVMRHHKEIYL